MRRNFRRGRGTTVRDGTRVYPFLNPADSTNDLPLELFSGASVALGELRPRQASKIHLHPLVTIMVWVVSGRLSLRLKDRRSSMPYTLRLRAEDGAVALPGTFLQLLNESRARSCSTQAGTSSCGCVGVRPRSRNLLQCAPRVRGRCAS